LTELLQDIEGASEIVDWFGRWPSFHDAEVLSVVLERASESCIKIHTFEMTNKVDPRGFYVLQKHVIVSFWFEEVLSLSLTGFNNQNVISGLDLHKTNDEYEMILYACYGVEGRIISKKVRITMEPGIPTQGVYAKSVTT
jgi:hypothetical protein